ncbi:hypothetical protein [Aquimarina sp. SS2-1]|uniref:hypothetical protein n=1 Tax=Aquimarina besae TaxID=3342247 RepID=UPI00366E022F
MKKTIFTLLFSTSVLFVSCDGDDVEDAACDVAEDALQLSVEAAIEAYEADQNETTCQAIKDTVEEYRNLECTSDLAYADEIALLPLDCADAGN